MMTAFWTYHEHRIYDAAIICHSKYTKMPVDVGSYFNSVVDTINGGMLSNVFGNSLYVSLLITCVIFEDIPGGKVRVSSRSKDNRLDVSAVCAQFGGGGHRMASGARMKGPIGAAADKFLQALEHEVRRID